jgi:hypothetical protein
MTLSEHNPFAAFGVVDPERTGLDFLKSMLERRAPSPPFSETSARAFWNQTGNNSQKNRECALGSTGAPILKGRRRGVLACVEVIAADQDSRFYCDKRISGRNSREKR